MIQNNISFRLFSLRSAQSERCDGCDVVALRSFHSIILFMLVNVSVCFRLSFFFAVCVASHRWIFLVLAVVVVAIYFFFSLASVDKLPEDFKHLPALFALIAHLAHGNE